MFIPAWVIILILLSCCGCSDRSDDDRERTIPDPVPAPRKVVRVLTVSPDKRMKAQLEYDQALVDYADLLEVIRVAAAERASQKAISA